MKKASEVFRILDRERRRGRKIVFTNGCFDLLHAGHVRLLKQAKSLGDILVVGLNADASVRRLKGPGRPILSLKERAEILENLKPVDFVVAFADDTPLRLVRRIRPHVLIKGGDWRPGRMVGGREVLSGGGRVVSGIFVKGRSTTSLVERIRRSR